MDEYAKRLIELEWEKIKSGTDIRPQIIELLEELKYEAYKEGYADGMRDSRDDYGHTILGGWNE